MDGAERLKVFSGSKGVSRLRHARILDVPGKGSDVQKDWAWGGGV